MIDRDGPVKPVQVRLFATFAHLAALAVLIGFSGCASREIISAIDAPEPKSFLRSTVSKGAQLAQIGNCASCHTAPGGKPYAGGRALKTPFGTVYGTNITPDPETGIGRWSQAAFTRAMREGVDRAGQHLYPAFPYDHFTHLTDEDIGSLYAFIMTRDPVRAENRSNTIPIPRAFIAIWNAYFLKRTSFKPNAARSEEWNRGAYLVEGLGHCGACHSPRNVAGAEKKHEAFSGGDAEGWHAPALNAASPSPVLWTAEALATYLQSGIAQEHAVTAGPMAEVGRNLAQAPSGDVRAIAAYVASLKEHPAARVAPVGTGGEDSVKDPIVMRGKAVYVAACADCHDRGRGVDGGALPLRLAIGLTIPTPRNLAYIIRDGIVPAPGERGTWMPAFSGALGEEQLADLLVYLRSLTGKPAWKNVPAHVRELDREKK